MFSDLNNLKIVSSTSKGCYDSFGFTEPEVFAALDEFGLSDRKEELKQYVIHSTPSWEMRNMNCS